jgi:AbrB family looped-hinge helix DNA binding protein
MSEATVTSRGRITIPADIRKALGVSAGEQITFTQLGDGSIVIRPKTRSLADLGGILKKSGQRHVAVDDMNIGRD